MLQNNSKLSQKSEKLLPNLNFVFLQSFIKHFKKFISEIHPEVFGMNQPF